jgi:hypothetical protein
MISAGANEQTGGATDRRDAAGRLRLRSCAHVRIHVRLEQRHLSRQPALSISSGSAAASAIYHRFQPLTSTDIAEAMYWIATLPSHVNIDRLELMRSASPGLDSRSFEKRRPNNTTVSANLERGGSEVASYLMAPTAPFFVTKTRG